MGEIATLGRAAEGGMLNVCVLYVRKGSVLVSAGSLSVAIVAVSLLKYVIGCQLIVQPFT